MKFPKSRPRRLRQNAAIRKLVRQNTLMPHDLVLPIFIKEGIRTKKPVLSMPGVYQNTLASALRQAQEAFDRGVVAVILFGIPKSKNPLGTEAFSNTAILQKLIQKIKKFIPDLLVITDVCMCEYTSHGHCGHLLKSGKIDNDKSIKTLAKIALSHARAGADIVAPSDMMDGRVGAIRNTLDKQDFKDTAIMSYAVKHASSFYGPFRDVAENTPKKGDRKSYQMDPANSKETLLEAKMDVGEGADFILIKPALPCLDLIHQVSQKLSCPVGAYSVSGEYAMLKAASAKGWIKEKEVAIESLTAIKRAGANFIIHYGAKDIATWIK